MSSFESYLTSGDFVSVIESMIASKVESDRPKPRGARVVSINTDERYCMVTFNGDTTPVKIPYGATAPAEVGQVVRVEGVAGDRYIADVLGDSAAQALAAAAYADADAAQTIADRAVAAAADAQATADGKTRTFFQAEAPTGLVADDVGDMWFDTDDGNKLYRWAKVGSVWKWEVADDQRIGQAITNAQNASQAAGTAQSTADRKVTTFYQAAQPAVTGRTEGDLWIKTDNGNELWRWTTSPAPAQWRSARDTSIAAAAGAAAAANDLATSALTAAQAAQAVADNAIRTWYQPSAPVGLNNTTDVGDLWYDTDDNLAYRWLGTGAGEGWKLIQDSAAAVALAAAQNAQTTADGKIDSFYQGAAPTAAQASLGDLWYNTSDKNKVSYLSSKSPMTWTPVRDLTIADAQQGVNEIKSRGIDLVTNGTGMMGNNSNWSEFIFDPADTPIGGGAFNCPARKSYGKNDESMPVDLSREYLLRMQVKQKGTNLDQTFFFGVQYRDIMDEVFGKQNHQFVPGTTTTLAADLKPGDTVVKLTSLANWLPRPDTVGGTAYPHLRYLGFWDYIDPKGGVWGPETFTKNLLGPGAWSGDSTAFDTAANTIRLQVPYAGPLKKAGLKVSQMSGGDGAQTYFLPTNTIAPSKWTTYEGTLTPAMIPAGTASVRILFAYNYDGTKPVTNSNISFAAVSFSDATATRAQADKGVADAAAADAKAVSAKTAADTAKAAADTAKGVADAAKAAAVLAQQSAINVVQDSEFESQLRPATDRWTYTTAEKRSGTRALAAVANSKTDNYYFKIITTALAERQPVKLGQTWRARVWYKTTADFNGTTGNAKLRLGNQAGTLLNGEAFTKSTEWRMVEIVREINANIIFLTLDLMADNTVGTLYVDDIELVDITEVLRSEAAAKAASDAAVVAKAAADAADQKAVGAKKAADDAQASANTAQGTANSARSEAGTAQTTANNARSEAASAQSVANQAAQDVITAQNKANTAASAATAAQTTADTAGAKALEAAGIANAKGKVYYQDAAPAGDANGLWIKTLGGANTPHRWVSNAWAPVTDTVATQAAAAASTAQGAANTAKGAADAAAGVAAQAVRDAATAKTAADTADAKAVKAQADATTAIANAAAANSLAVSAGASAATAIANAATAKGVADGKTNTFFQPSMPTGMTELDVDDLWFDTDDNNRMYRWTKVGTTWSWVAADDQRISKAVTDAFNAGQAAGTAQQTADRKVVTFYQGTAPAATGRTVGDMWVDTSQKNELKRWEGGSVGWRSVRDLSIAAASEAAVAANAIATSALSAAQAAQAVADNAIRTWYQTTAPTGLNNTTDIGDLWYDTDDNLAYRWMGTGPGQGWTIIKDSAAAVALAAAQNAQTTADGKIDSFYQGSAPTIAQASVGDLWYNTADKNKVSYLSSKSPMTWTPVRDLTIADAQQGVDEIKSRGIDLVTNGTGMLGDNTNFKSFTFDPTDTPVGGGSFDITAANASPVTNELIPVDLQKKYQFSWMSKQKVAGSRFRMYGMVVPYDIAGGQIAPIMYMHQANTTTTLAVDLRPGDTTITLTSAANWNNTAADNASHLRSIIIWNYVDSKGKAWGTETYSRNYLADAWPVGGISGNVITLRTPWKGVAAPAGTAVSNGSSGGNYMYIGASNVIVPEEWTAYAGECGGAMTSAETVGAAVTKFPPGTAFIRVGWLTNRPEATGTQSSKHSFAAVSFSDATAARSRADAAVTEAQTAKSNAAAAQTRADKGVADAELARQAAVTAKSAADTAATAAAAAASAAVRAQQSAINVIPDPSFEAQLRTPNNARYSYTTGDKHSGTRALLSMGSPTIASVDLLPEPLPVKTGQTWRLRAWYRTSADWNGTAGNSKIRWADQNNTIISAPAFSVSTAWKLLETVITINDPTKTAFQMIVSTDHTVGALWLDDVELVEVTEILRSDAAAKAAADAAATAKGIADTAVANAAAAQSTATTAKDNAATAQRAADAARGVADTALANASAANAAAVAADERAGTAITNAATAAAKADGKANTWFQTTAPTGMNPLTDVDDIWFKTDDNNKMFRYTGAGGWVEADDKRISKAVTDAQTANSAAGTAKQIADSKVTTYFQGSPPSSTGRTTGDLWVDTSTAAQNELKRWSGSAWQSMRDLSIAAASSSAAAAITAAGNAQRAADEAKRIADNLVTTYYQDDAPTGLNNTDNVGDLWLETDTNIARRWNGTGWVVISNEAIGKALQAAQNAQTTADGKIDSFYQNTQPTVGMVGDLWFHTGQGNKPFYCTKAAPTPTWTPVQDTAIGAAQETATNAGKAATAAQEAANTAGNNATKAIEDAAKAALLANKKTQTYFQTSQPTGQTADNVGDLWFDIDDNNKMYRYTAAGWVVNDDQRISLALTEADKANKAAGVAQGTADKKITTYYQDEPPAAAGQVDGNLWIDTNDNRKMYRWNSQTASWIGILTQVITSDNVLAVPEFHSADWVEGQDNGWVIRKNGTAEFFGMKTRGYASGEYAAYTEVNAEVLKLDGADLGAMIRALPRGYLTGGKVSETSPVATNGSNLVYRINVPVTEVGRRYRVHFTGDLYKNLAAGGVRIYLVASPNAPVVTVDGGNESKLFQEFLGWDYGEMTNLGRKQVSHSASYVTKAVGYVSIGVILGADGCSSQFAAHAYSPAGRPSFEMTVVDEGVDAPGTLGDTRVPQVLSIGPTAAAQYKGDGVRYDDPGNWWAGTAIDLVGHRKSYFWFDKAQLDKIRLATATYVDSIRILVRCKWVDGQSQELKIGYTTVPNPGANLPSPAPQPVAFDQMRKVVSTGTQEWVDIPRNSNMWNVILNGTLTGITYGDAAVTAWGNAQRYEPPILEAAYRA